MAILRYLPISRSLLNLTPVDGDVRAPERGCGKAQPQQRANNKRASFSPTARYKPIPANGLRRGLRRWRVFRCLATLALTCIAANDSVYAAPAGMTVQSGSAKLSTSGSQLNVTVSENAFLNWQSFNIAPGETTRFFQPSASSIVWNHIHDEAPSQIYGNLEANGVVVLMNQSGFFFGPNAFVNAAGLVVSTAPTTAVTSGAGLFWQFNGAPPQAGIINYGRLNVERGGSLFLIGQHIENRGILNAPEGNVGLLAGKEVLLNERADGRGLSAAVRLPSGSIDNTGRIIADAGTIALNAQVVNQNGALQANSVRERNGVIELLATEAVKLEEHSEITVHGDATAETSDGGQIRIKSGGSFDDVKSSRIDVSGGVSGGNGGQVEISAPVISSIHSRIDAHAQSGGRGGQLFLDPTDIVIGNSGGGTIENGAVSANDSPATLNLDVNSAFLGFSQITLQATRNITLSAGTLWDLAASTGLNEPGSQLKLEAGNNISLANGSSIVASDNWSLTLQAGRDFTSPDQIIPSLGNITLSGTASVQTQNGNISLTAGNNVTVSGGFVRTMGGGNIDVTAVLGSVNAGTHPNGFNFRPTSPGYLVDPDLGGISTASGGNVSITAGKDIISYLPPADGPQTDGGSGAFGAAPGNVTLAAGHDVAGHFVVRNGTGEISAGHDAGTSARQLALSLVSGGWEVDAANDIVLQEVRNPNGIFNNLGFGSSVTRHLFDYSIGAYALLAAGHAVQLTGSALPRNDDNFERGITPIYPGRLEITAGSGGITLGNDVTLFPSPEGQWRITTTDGGSLTGSKAGDLVQFVMSDSAKLQYRATGDFGIGDHADTPVHLNDSDPVEFKIAGDLNGILIGAPKRAEIDVAGNMISSRFDGQNLHPNDRTAIHVAGDLLNRSEFTTVPIEAAPDFNVFDRLFLPLPALLANLPNQFYYDPAAKTLTFQGRMNNDQLQALLNLQAIVFDPFGQPVFDSQGNFLTEREAFTSQAALERLFAESQDIPLNPNTGYRIGGGGIFDITARNLDLGSTAGIVSQGPRANHALADYFTRGADINVSLGGNLDMFSTTIASLNGGDISVTAEGAVNVGSKTFHGADTSARGIFTTAPSDVAVQARGDINVNGSRIAAYDGGNVFVKSLEGNVDAGTGGRGSTPVERIYVDPITRVIKSYTPTIPGSGILATTFPPPLDASVPSSQSKVGDILVETPRGNIVTGAGGVVQVSLNGSGNGAGTVTLRAGTKDGDGHSVYPGNIDASGSGVIGSTVHLDASGEIKGVVVARANLDVSAVQSVNVAALAQGDAVIHSDGTISGTIIGIGGINAGGATVDAALLSQNVTANGAAASDQAGFSAGTAANATSQSIRKDEPEKILANAKGDDQEDEWIKRKLGSAKPKLTRTVGRVTVIMP